MYLILTVITLVVLLTMTNYGVPHFIAALIVLATVWFFLIYYPKKRNIKYFSLFTLLIGLALMSILILSLLLNQ